MERAIKSGACSGNFFSPFRGVHGDILPVPLPAIGNPEEPRARGTPPGAYFFLSAVGVIHRVHVGDKVQQLVGIAPLVFASEEKRENKRPVPPFW